jgi:hypothetical protein
MRATLLSPPRLHLNEHLSEQLAAQLRRHGFDVTSSEETGLLSEPDERQLAFAASQQRAILTINHKDFIRLNRQYLAEGLEHWGIILSTEVPINVMFRRMLAMMHAVSAEELRNQIRWLNEFEAVESVSR